MVHFLLWRFLIQSSIVEIMNKEKRIQRALMAVAIGFGLGFAVDKVAHGSVPDQAAHQETPTAVLPKEVVLFAPPQRIKK